MAGDTFVLVNGKVFSVDFGTANEIERTCNLTGQEVSKETLVRHSAVEERKAAGAPKRKSGRGDEEE